MLVFGFLLFSMWKISIFLELDFFFFFGPISISGRDRKAFPVAWLWKTPSASSSATFVTSLFPRADRSLIGSEFVVAGARPRAVLALLEPPALSAREGLQCPGALRAFAAVSLSAHFWSHTVSVLGALNYALISSVYFSI